MAQATISQTFYPDGTCSSLTMRVTVDIIDDATTVETAIQNTAVLWKIADTEPGTET